jgi:tRNA modification GTPase
VEISAHGSPFVLQKILSLCFRQGSRLASPGEFTLRAFLAGKIDLTQAEATADLIRAKSDKAQAAAVAQLQGHLAGKVRRLREALLPLLAHVEIGLDHSDEDHDFLVRKDLVSKCHDVQKQIDELLASARVGKILRQGLRVALVGRPNVGKSSLLNALLKEDRAIVTPIAGTTRDTLEENVHWDGLPVVLTDTAGVREVAGDSIERLGMERTRQALERADVVLCLFDASEPILESDKQIIQECLSRPHLWVVNKSDLPARWSSRDLAAYNGKAPTVSVSAKTGEGLPLLVEEVKRLTMDREASFSQAEIAINARHRDALQRARNALQEATRAAESDVYEECVALEIKTALQALGEIIGETATEDLLDQIFSTFCVGK